MNDASNAGHESTPISQARLSELESGVVANVCIAVQNFLQITAACALAESPELFRDVDARIRAGHAHIRVTVDAINGRLELSAKAVDVETGEEFAAIGSKTVQRAALNG